MKPPAYTGFVGRNINVKPDACFFARSRRPCGSSVGPQCAVFREKITKLDSLLHSYFRSSFLAARLSTILTVL